MEQRNLFEGQRRADEAVARVGRNADRDWLKAARLAVIEASVRHVEFTTDEVWAVLSRDGFATHERRALGAVMRSVAAEGVVEPTDRYRPSSRPESHARPVRVWRGRP